MSRNAEFCAPANIELLALRKSHLVGVKISHCTHSLVQGRTHLIEVPTAATKHLSIYLMKDPASVSIVVDLSFCKGTVKHAILLGSSVSQSHTTLQSSKS